MGEVLRFERLSCEDLRKRARRFLKKHHPDDSIPIPIEEIIDLQLRMDIIPMPGLRNSFEIDGCVANDLSSIFVDEFIHARRPNQYRFRLAHELPTSSCTRT